MDWDDVRHFLALARAGSVRAAGAALNVSHSTVARRVEALEERFQARLFDRSRDGYTLTDAGRDMLPIAERIESEMAALERGLVGLDTRLVGSVAITCCDSYVSSIVLRGLAPFCEEHPGIALSFTNDSRPFDLTKREADIAIRAMSRELSPPEHLVGQRLVPITVANYIARRGGERVDPERPQSSPRWIAFAPPEVHQRMVAESSYPDVPPWGEFHTLEVGVQAAAEGLGMIMLPTYVGDREERLRRLPEPNLRHVADLWLVSHPDLRMNARFRATRLAVSRALTAEMPLFAGEAPLEPQRHADVTERPANEPSAKTTPTVG